MKPEVDLKNFRLRRIGEKEYRHALLALYWPIYILIFILIENFITGGFHEMHMPLDDLIPFNEWFVIPYCVWYFVWSLPLLLYVVFDVKSFRKLSYFLIAAYTVCHITYLVYPTCQCLRPEVFPRENFLTFVVSLIYSADTSTNVCPSMHVVGSFAAAFSVTHSKLFRDKKWVIAVFWVLAVLISLSTLFMKQHSVIDVMWGVILSAVCYIIFYRVIRFD
ncbi:MAG: phosphatase PAP2 family protein [Clostridia bacterium]|nr:phosphatase PAP2 family protein [Clostridia bacterium]